MLDGQLSQGKMVNLTAFKLQNVLAYETIIYLKWNDIICGTFWCVKEIYKNFENVFPCEQDWFFYRLVIKSIHGTYVLHCKQIRPDYDGTLAIHHTTYYDEWLEFHRNLVVYICSVRGRHACILLQRLESTIKLIMKVCNHKRCWKICQVNLSGPLVTI